MKAPNKQIREQYEIEKKLANRLRQSSREERGALYTSLYDEYYNQFPYKDITARSGVKNHVSSQLVFLKRFIKPSTVFAEIGPGDCSLSLALTQIVSQVYAVDVSAEVSQNTQPSKNFKLIISDGRNVPLPSKSIDVVYSNQLMEHLHPDDAVEQLNNIVNVLVDGGIYICITPSRINGPHDISKYFDKVASGFHLREYTFTELNKIFKKAGFKATHGYWGSKGIYIRVPLFLISSVERLIALLPRRLRRSVFLRPFLSIRIVGMI